MIGTEFGYILGELYKCCCADLLLNALHIVSCLLSIKYVKCKM